MEILKGLDKLKGSIVIQMHDNPDADCIGAAYGIEKLLNKFGLDAIIVYGGKRISKPNLVKFVDYLKMKPKFYTELEVTKFDNLITVDCQYGQGNVSKIEALNIYCIDHHNQDSFFEFVEYDIRREYIASCSLIYKYLIHYEVELDERLATALFYGIQMDSNEFRDTLTESDIEAREGLSRICDRGFLKKVKYENLSSHDVDIIQKVLASIENDLDLPNIVISGVAECDQNLLGVISDYVLGISGITISVIYTDLKDSWRFSVRSVEDNVSAYFIIQSSTKTIGNGGGHTDKAGGVIYKDRFKKYFPRDTIGSYTRRIVLNCWQTYCGEKEEIS